MKLAWMVAFIISLSCGIAKAGNDPSFVPGTWTGTGVFQPEGQDHRLPRGHNAILRIAGQLRLCGLLAQMRGVSRDDPAHPPYDLPWSGKFGMIFFVIPMLYAA